MHGQSYPEKAKLKRIVELGDAELRAEKWPLSGGRLLAANFKLAPGGQWRDSMVALATGCGRGRQSNRMNEDELVYLVPLWCYQWSLWNSCRR